MSRSVPAMMSSPISPRSEAWKAVTYHGTVNGTIDLGSGNDTFKGGNNAEKVQDGDGADTWLGGGNDRAVRRTQHRRRRH
ncbi:MAG: hypothetical protein R3D01_13330 [Hyphomicrobiales bacterium]